MRAHLPNLLTLARILAVPLLVLCLWGATKFGALLGFILFCVAGLTDFLDGYLARAQGTVSKLGQFLDPVADKIMVAAVIVMLVATRQVEGLHVVPALVILLREITVSGLREFLAGIQVSMPVSRLAKWKTAVQMVSLGALILAVVVEPGFPAQAIGLAGLWVAAAITLITGYDYLRLGLKHLR